MTSEEPEMHRPKEVPLSGFAATHSTIPIGAVIDLPGCPEDKETATAMVTKLLEHHETRTNPQAREALWKEGRALADVGTWDESTVQEKEAIASEAKRTGETVHFGNLLGICSITNFEMDQAKRKYTGRWCF